MIPADKVPADRWRLLVLILLAICVRGFTVANTTVPSRDCIVFVRDGLQLESPPSEFNGSRLAVLRKLEHHPGYPVAIIVMSWPVRSTLDGTTVESMALSAQLVSALSAVLITFPLYILARRIFDRNVAFAATAIFLVLPVYVDVTSDGISDGLFLLTAAWALWFAIRALDAVHWRNATVSGVGAGICCGLGYIVRPDIAVVMLAIGLTCAGTVLNRLASQGYWPAPLVAGLGLCVGVAASTSPYVAAIGKLTNKPTAKRVSGTDEGEGPTFYRRDQSRTVNVPLGAWWDPVRYEGQSKPAWAAKALWTEFLKASHYVVPAFGLIGLLAVRRRWHDPRIALLVLTGVIHLSVLYRLAWKTDYVSQRHTLLTVMITCIFAAVALPVVGSWIARLRPGSGRAPWYFGTILALAIMAVALPRDLRSLHYERAGHKQAGLWLKAHGEPDVPIVDPFGWAEWYAGRTLDRWPNPSPAADRDLYLVFEPESDSPHSRLEKYAFVRDLHTKCEPLAEFAVAGKPTKKVVIYRFTYQQTKTR